MSDIIYLICQMQHFQHFRAHASDIAQDFKQDLILPDGWNVSEITVLISIVSCIMFLILHHHSVS